MIPEVCPWIVFQDPNSRREVGKLFPKMLDQSLRCEGFRHGEIVTWNNGLKLCAVCRSSRSDLVKAPVDISGIKIGGTFQALPARLAAFIFFTHDLDFVLVVFSVFTERLKCC
ncbi:MAG: hypothetical protein Ct9H300mP21_01270 [Pseudomonadota bacterium]|nr:MAG: hypothetical protein Ct9H300mP21_01270 [Pseudomonadota bacterium]